MTPSLDHFPFARPHLHGVCAKAARLHPSSLGRAATLNHSERQRSSGTALGLRWGMYRTTCAVGTTGRRFAGLGCHRRGFEFPAPRGYDLLTGRGLVGSGLFSADGRDCRPFLASIQHGRQGTFQRLAKGPHLEMQELCGEIADRSAATHHLKSRVSAVVRAFRRSLIPLLEHRGTEK